MKKFLYLPTLLFIILIFIACNQEEPTPSELPQNNSDEAEITIDEIVADQQQIGGTVADNKGEENAEPHQPTLSAVATEEIALPTKEPEVPSPIKFKNQFAVNSGGGGFRLDIPQNCLEKHYGIVNYSEPVIVEGLMTGFERTLQIPQAPSEILEELPSLCACGFNENEEVSLSINSPNNETILKTSLISQPITDVAGQKINGAYCIASNIVDEFDFLPDDPIGTYEFELNAASGQASHFVELLPDRTPSFYYSERKNGYILSGFRPNEQINVLFYRIPSEGEPRVIDQSITVDSQGNYVTESEFLDSSLAYYRGNPTTSYFEGKYFYHAFTTPTGFVIYNPEIDWEALHAEFPDNPYLYYYRDIYQMPLMRTESAFSAYGSLLDAALEIDDEFVPAYVSRGYTNAFKINATEEDLNASVAYFNKALELDPSYRSAYLGRARALWLQNQNESAIQDIETFISLEPDMPNTFYYAGCMYSLFNQDEKMNASYDKWVEVQNNPNSAIETFNLENWYGCQTRLDTYLLEFGKFDQDQLLFDSKERFATHPVDDMRMAFVPAGEFLMGSSESDLAAEPIEKPQNTIDLDGYWIDQHEVTIYQYSKCINVGVCSPSETNISSQFRFSFSDSPAVTGVSWEDAKTYCEWAGRRLPTEAEWEKAARGTDGRIYPWGDLDISNCVDNQIIAYSNVNYASSGVRLLAYEGQNFSCAAPSGAIDMIGNAWEWVSDYFDPDYYQDLPLQNPQGPNSGEDRVLKGGSWTTTNPNFLRVANRWNKPQNFTDTNIGFRCAMSKTEVTESEFDYSILDEIEALALKVPEISYYEIGQSVNNQGVLVTQIGSGPHHFVLIGGMRGNQQMARYFLSDVADRYTTDDTYFTTWHVPEHVSIHILPSLNPDAFQEEERLNQNGVDLNRNWETPSWTADSPQPSGIVEGSGGSYPLSEPETQAAAMYLNFLKENQNTESVSLILITDYASAIQNGTMQPGYIDFGDPEANSETLAQFLADEMNFNYIPVWTGSYQPTGEIINWGPLNNIASVEIELPLNDELGVAYAGENGIVMNSFMSALFAFFSEID